jgi:hypothetical protein
MNEDAEITLDKILRAISRLTDAELLQLKAAARKEAEKRGLKTSGLDGACGAGALARSTQRYAWHRRISSLALALAQSAGAATG